MPKTHARASIAVCALIAACGAAASADDRSIDGYGNNSMNPEWGMAGSDLMRMSPSAYADGIYTMAGSARPNPRAISNAVSAQSASRLNTRGLTDFVWAWGQFVDHDLDLTPDGSGEAAPIAVPAGDPWLDPFNTGTAAIPFTRSSYNPATGQTTPRQQINVITAYMDGSMVYGSDSQRADWLRTHSGGRMKTSSSATGDFLPYNDGTMEMANPFGPPTSTSLFVAGDVRANETPSLAALHTLFVREHNRWADQIAADHADWTDDQVYERARKIVGAEIQAITYNEFLPALIGEDAFSGYAGYDQECRPDVRSEFSTTAYRLGHTMLSSVVRRIDENGNTIAEGDLNLFQGFFNPDVLVNEGGLDPLMRGLAAQRAQDIDPFVIDDVRNMLFGPPGSGGMDLVSLNIQRGRDHGLPDYNSIREVFGLDRVDSFEDINADPEIWQRLASVYASVDEIDPWVGMVSEEHADGAAVGELIRAILIDQFAALRDGDWFFFMNDDVLTGDEEMMDYLAHMRLSDIILLNTDITSIRGNVFLIPAPGGAGVLALAGFAAMRRRRR